MMGTAAHDCGTGWVVKHGRVVRGGEAGAAVCESKSRAAATCQANGAARAVQASVCSCAPAAQMWTAVALFSSSRA